ncbi:hypothetical protein CRYUN_Cryun13aG0036700 [Craigia yunnanensis]
MIEGLAMHGYGEEAIQAFHEMEGCGIRPDWITFVSLLYACSHAGLIEQGCSYFSRMKDVYDMEPTIEHYGCMVDLYGRAGYLQKAYDFVCQMPISPNAIIWQTLLGACSIHGNVDLAEQVKEKLAELEPDDSSDNVLLSNIYAVAGKSMDVASLRRSMTDQKTKKTPGWSLREVMFLKLQVFCMTYKRKKRKIQDCHTVMKLISKVYGLKIVVRYRNRFHSFNDGSCSCKDYWSLDNAIHIYYEEHEMESTDPPKDILMIPTISDTSTVEEWRAIARDILGRSGKVNRRATIVDWPGLGYSSRPKMDNDADVMEKLAVDFINKRFDLVVLSIVCVDC